MIKNENTSRSYIMSQIKAKDTKPEILVRKYLHRNGFRYKLHDKSLPGSPDIVLPRYNTVIFVHGCFWHSHGCNLAKPPKSNLDYWLPKLDRVVERSKKNIIDLKKDGWKVLVVWECDLLRNPIPTLDNVMNKLKSAYESIG